MGFISLANPYGCKACVNVILSFFICKYLRTKVFLIHIKWLSGTISLFRFMVGNYR